MTEPEQPAPVDPALDPELDPAADTTMFQAFVRRAEQQDDTERAKAVGAPFRIMTLVIGLGVFAGLVWLLLKI